jgi:hypothetical protein
VGIKFDLQQNACTVLLKKEERNGITDERKQLNKENERNK